MFTNAQLSSVVAAVSLPVVAIAVLVTILIGLAFIRVLLRAAGSSKIALLAVSLGVLAVVSGVSSLLAGAG